jgi:hypothetical protein
MGMRPRHQSAPPGLEERGRNQNQVQYAHDLSNQQRQQATSSGSSRTSNAHPTNDAAPTHQGSFFDPGEEASAQEPNPCSHTPLGQGQLSPLRLDAFFPRIITRGFLDDLVSGSSSANLPAQAVRAGRRLPLLLTLPHRCSLSTTSSGKPISTFGITIVRAQNIYGGIGLLFQTLCRTG